MFNRRRSRELWGSERGAAVGVLATLVVLISVGIFLLYFVFGTVVPPNFIGVRQNYYSMFGLKKGFSDKGLEPGLHFRIPGLTTVFVIPRDFQFVHFNRKRIKGDLSLPELDVPTKDGSKVKTDVTLVVRYHSGPDATAPADQPPAPETPEGYVPFMTFRDRAHGGPSDLVRAWTVAQQRQLETFSRIAENEMRQKLGELSTTNYYNPVLREIAALEANESINELVADEGVEVWGSLVRRYIYAEKTIDDQIFAKNLQDQTEQLNAARSRLAEAKAETERQRALWDAKIRDLEVEGDADVQVILSEGSLYEASKKADGDLLVETAKAEVDEAKASALHEIRGADTYIARELAPILGTLRGGIVTDVDPYNIGEWVDKLTGTETKAGG